VRPSACVGAGRPVALFCPIQSREAAFYSYAYPEPPGFRDAAMPAGAWFDTTLGEFVLPFSTEVAGQN